MKYKSIVIGALLAAVILSVSMSLNYRNTSKIREHNLTVDRSKEAIVTLQTLLSSLKDAETGQRGYLLSGEEEYLEPYEEATGSIYQTLDQAQGLLSEVPSLAPQFSQLRSLVESMLSELQQMISLRRDRGYQPAARIFDTDQSRLLMESIRKLTTELIEEERELLDSRQRQSDDAYRIAIASGLISGFSALASIAALFLLVRRHVDERDAASRKITEQSELLRTTLASIGDGVITTDKSGHVTSLNEVAEEITGWTTADSVGLSIKDVFPLYYSDSGQEAAHPVLASIHCDDVVKSVHNTQLKTKTGEWVYVDCSASPIANDEDDTVGSVLTFKDITFQRNREAALQKSESRLRAAFENAAVGIAHAQPDERIVRVNQRLSEILGYKEEELVGIRFSDITYPDDLELTRNSLHNMLTGEFRSQQFQKRYIRKDGTIVWVNKTISLVRDADNKPDYFITVIEDITERIAAQDALKESESHLRRVLDNTLAYVSVLSPDGTLLEINKAALELGNLSHADCIGNTLQSLPWLGYSQEVVERLQDAIKKAANGEVARYDETIRIQGSNTTIIDFIINPVKQANGKVTHLIATGIDISDRKRLEEELRVVAAELSTANKRKDEFLATLAHELRNPMAPIRTGLEILRLSHDDPVTMEETREMMERQTEQLIRLVDDLLDVSRITRGKLELRMEDIDLSSVISRAVEASRPIIDSFGHQLHMELPTQGITLHADPIRLAQVISNLLNNSAKYTQDGGRILLSAVREGDEVAITVRDNGTGIEADKKEFIFELFSQVKSEGDLATSGLGIGLTLARSLVEQHGGRISVESEGKNKGSTFTIHIPVVCSKKENMTKLPQDNDQAKLPRKVLVVDDSPTIQKTLSMVIRLQGHEVHTASDGQEAIQAVKELSPDIVFMDIGMPKTNGYEAAKQIRSDKSVSEDTVLVALTGWGGDEVSERIAEAGFNHHVVKPPEPETIRALISTAPCHSNASKNGT